ncbi:MAG: type II secretion system ATPase GspE [Nitrospinota bacterium]|nr:type II secretion system ATPase GspE [Nitrospinota bacterium]
MTDLKQLSEQLSLVYLDSLPSPDEAGDLVKNLPIGFARQSQMAPVKIEGDRLVVITSNPLDHHAVSDLRRIFKMPVSLRVASPILVTEFINRAYEISSGDSSALLDEVEEPTLESIAQELETSIDLLDTDDEAPIVKLLNSLLQQAIKEKASDVHIESYSDQLVVRMRMDGILYTVLKPPKRLALQIASRVKIMAGLDIAEKRLPQDGRISLKAAGREIDVRVSTIPTTFGERVVMRLLDKSRNLLKLGQIGMNETQQAQMAKVKNLSNGIVLITGPTGSGKTTTLYSVLAEIDTEHKNVITVEDPVEYQIRGIGQMQVNSNIGLTFADGLRAILRQDPDVIMVGEIRDHETASIAVQSSLTGHLVFSTLHTNDSGSAITRLIDIGIEPFLISSSLEAVMAQRLVRVLCPECKTATTLTKEEVRSLGLPPTSRYVGVKVYKPTGCPHCMNSGYKGRTGIYEFLEITDSLRPLIIKGADSNQIMAKAITDGMKTLRGDGLEKMQAGITSLDEVLRVTDETSTEELI